MIRILFDAAPLNSDLHSINDYGAMILLAPIAAPLLKYNEIEELVPASWCVSYERKHSGCTMVLELHPESKFSCGTPLLAEDYGMALRKVAASQTQLGYLVRRLAKFHASRSGMPIKDSFRLQISGRYLIVQTAEPDPLLHHMLAMPNLSPLNNTIYNNSSAGPYVIVKKKGGQLRMQPNKAFIGAGERPELRFDLCPDPWENYQRYHRGQAHITCNTAFPYELVASHRNDPCFHIGAAQLSMAIVFYPHGQGAGNSALRKALMHLIDR